MDVPGWAWVAAGCALIALVVTDVFLTVLDHWGGEGPLARRLYRGTWWVGRHLARALPPRHRRAVLGRIGPALIPLALVVWVGLAILGVALVFLPYLPDSVHAGSGIPAPRRLSDAVYYTAVTLFTLGYGDLVPTGPGLRAVAVATAGAGFAMVTLAISYFMSVFDVHGRQRAAAESLAAQTGDTADASRLLARHLRGGAGAQSVAREAASLRDRLCALRGGYVSAPIAHYFLSSGPELSLVRTLFLAHDLALLLDVAPDPGARPDLAGLGTRSGLAHAAARLRRTTARTLLRSGSFRTWRPADGAADADDPPRGAPTPETLARWRARYAEARVRLEAEDVAVRPDDAAAAEYAAARAVWEPELRACAEALGEDWEEVTEGR